MHPLTCRELGDAFDLIRALDIGMLPSIYLSDDAQNDLEAYVGTYLREEIVAEAIVRNVPAFTRFLTVAGTCNGRLINYSNIASDSQVPVSTVQEYFHILRDTLVGDDLPAWKATVKRKPLSTAKFFFFDIGVARFLQQRKGLQRQSPEFGEAFEAFIHHELKTFCDYMKQGTLCYWRSKSGFEVDFILADKTAIEVKAKPNVASRDMRGIQALKQEALLKNYLVVSLEDAPRRHEGIDILPWRLFLENLWGNQYS